MITCMTPGSGFAVIYAMPTGFRGSQDEQV